MRAVKFLNDKNLIRGIVISTFDFEGQNEQNDFLKRFKKEYGGDVDVFLNDVVDEFRYSLLGIITEMEKEKDVSIENFKNKIGKLAYIGDSEVHKERLLRRINTMERKFVHVGLPFDLFTFITMIPGEFVTSEETDKAKKVLQTEPGTRWQLGVVRFVMFVKRVKPELLKKVIIVAMEMIGTKKELDKVIKEIQNIEA